MASEEKEEEEEEENTRSDSPSHHGPVPMVGENVSAAYRENEHLDRAGNNGQGQYEDGVFGEAGGRQLKPGSYRDER